MTRRAAQEDAPQLRLRPLTAADEDEARRAQAELAEEGFTFLLGLGEADSWATYLGRLAAHRRGDVPPELVPETFLVADVAGQLVGRVSVRHRLNAELIRIGGHIGYAVRPAYRRRGYATEMLRQALDVAADVGVDRVLVTCDDGNAASAAAIERCSGVLESVVPGAPPKRRYWITTAP